MRTSKKHAFRSLFALTAALLLLLSVGCSAPANSTGTDTPPQNTTKQQPSDKKDNPPAKSDPSSAKDADKKASSDKAIQTMAAVSAPSLPASATSVLAAGVVSDSGVRLRSAPSTDSPILAELGSGTVVSLFASENNWYKVGYDCQTGYISADLVTMYQSSDSLSGYVVTTDALNMRSSASTDSSVVTTVSQNTYLTLIGFENGWFHVSDGSSSGYVSGDYTYPCASKPAADNSGSSGSSDSNSSSSGSSSLPSGGDAGSSSATGQAIADLAYSFLGYPYVYGGSGPSGFDCSGFIMYVYGQFGYSLPHGTNGQLGYGTPVDRSDLQPGDMIFFFDPDFGDGPTTHGGIYLGGGDFIHASTNGREEVQIHNLNTSSYYSSVFSAARRLAG